MLGLGVKVHADTSALDAAESRLEKFGEHFEHHFMRHLSKLAGSTALAVGAVRFIESIFGRPEEIDKLSMKFKLTTDEVQLLEKGFKEMGLTFEEGMGKGKKGTIDLLALMNEMRKKHGMPVITKEDVKTTVGDINTVKEAYEHVKDTAAHYAAKSLRAFSLTDAEKRAGDKEQQSIDYYNDHGLSSLGKEKGLKQAREAVADMPSESQSEESKNAGTGADLGKSGFFAEMRRQAGLKAELERLNHGKKWFEDDEKEKNSRQSFAGELTGRQSIGAYTRQTGGIESKLDKSNEFLEAIEARIGEVKEEQKRISDG